MVDPLPATTDLDQPGSYANRFVARHNHVGNLAFVDGHAQRYKGNRPEQKCLNVVPKIANLFNVNANEERDFRTANYLL